MSARAAFYVLAAAIAAITPACSVRSSTRAMMPLQQNSSTSSALYVANRWGNSIFVYQPGRDRPSREVTDGVASPIALAQDGDGNLFVANAPEYKNGWVSVYARGSDKATRIITSGITALDSIALDPAGDLFVANRLGDAVYEFAPGTKTIERTIAQGVVAPVALAADASGYLYVSNCQDCLHPTQHDTITIYAPQNMRPFRTLTTSYHGPGDIAFDKSGKAYADVNGSISVYAKHGLRLVRKIRGAAGFLTFDRFGDLYSAQVKYYNSGGRVLVYPPGGSSPAYTITKGIYDPGAVTTDSAANLYVANSARNAIAVYAYGSSKASRTITVATGLEFPTAIAFDESDNLYAANTQESTVTVYAPGSSDVLRTITAGVVSPSALAFDEAGNLYVGNVDGNLGGGEVGGSITVYAPGRAHPLLSIAKDVHGATYGLAFDNAGNLYVASGCPYHSNPISVYAPGSRSVLHTLSQGVSFPCAIALDAAGNLYVGNVGSSTVAVFPAGASEPSRTIERGVDYPDALTFARNGDLFVTNARGGSGKTWGSVTVYGPGRSKPARTISQGLTGGGGPGGSVFGPSGELYVVDSPKIVVYPRGGDTPIRTIREGLDAPTSPIFDRSGNLYVANQSNSTITEYAAGTSKLIRTIPAVKAYPDALIFGPP